MKWPVIQICTKRIWSIVRVTKAGIPIPVKSLNVTACKENRMSADGINRGFTLVELAIVIALISILAAVALPRMISTYDNAHQAAVLGTGGALASAVILVRTQWIANGSSKAVNEVIGFGSDDVATSSDGWPTDAGQGAGSNNSAVMDSPARCVRIWRGLLVANSPSVTENLAVGSDYLVDTVNGNCRYSYRKTDESSNIIYNARTGEVITNI